MNQAKTGGLINMTGSDQNTVSPQCNFFVTGLSSETDADVVTAHWIDTWHMGDKVMACRGTTNDNGEISVVGSYAAPPGPAWGWQTVITPRASQSLRLVMFNISPDGQEDLAVETDYRRV